MDDVNQKNKALVWGLWQSLGTPAFSGAFERAVSAGTTWHGFEPLRHMHGAAEIWGKLWQPLLHAMPDLMRRPYHFIGGAFENRHWVSGTGDFIGTFAKDWLGIPATGKSVRFRFGEFCRVENGQIVEIRCIVDLPHLAHQAGIDVVPASTGRDIWVPGPMAGDGVLLVPQDPAESARTLNLVETMIFGGLNNYDQKDQNSQGLERFWHPHMVWHGPRGIGSVYGLDDFKRNAQGPILRAFPDRKGAGHQARLAEGCFASSTGWPSLVGTHVNDYMDWPATGQRIGWNIMDFWKRDGDKLLENWVMIDLIGAAKASGVDLLARMADAV